MTQLTMTDHYNIDNAMVNDVLKNVGDILKELKDEETVTFMRSCNSMHEFDIKYCRKHGLAIDGDMVYKPE